MKKNNGFIGFLAVIIAGTLWGGMGIFVRKMTALGLTSLQIVSVRASLTTIIIFLFLLIYKKELLKIKIRDIPIFIGSGFFSIVFFSYCYFSCITYTSLSVAATLLYTAPAMVMLMSILFFKEKFTVYKISALIIAFLGCACVTGVISGNLALSTKGIMLGIGAGFGYALYSIFSRLAINKGYNSFTIIFYTFAIALVFLIPFTPWKKISSVMFASSDNALYFILFALVTTALPYIFYTLGLTRIESGKASVIASSEPVSATVLGYLFLNEKLTSTSIAGIVCVVISIVLLAVPVKENKNNKRGKKHG